MFRFTKKPSSRSHNQYLAKITSLVQCIYRRRTDVSAMAAYYGVLVVHSANVYACTMHNTYVTQVIICRHSTDNVCTTSIYTLNQACNFS